MDMASLLEHFQSQPSRKIKRQKSHIIIYYLTQGINTLIIKTVKHARSCGLSKEVTSG